MLKNKIKWAISTEIWDRPGIPSMQKALDRANIEYFHSDFNAKTREYADIPYLPGESVVLYGPIKFIKTKNKYYHPGAFGFKKETNTSFYMTMLNKDLFFNGDCIYLPYGQIEQKSEFLFDTFGDGLFIRPDTGFKSFTGFSVNSKEFDYELKSLTQLHNPDLTEMCLISKAQKIITECRFVVCSGKVVAGSQYRRDGISDVRLDTDASCLEFAKKVTENSSWTLDTCYTIDIFLDEHRGPLIGEFNSFASAGLYMCDRDIVVREVTQTAMDELI